MATTDRWTCGKVGIPFEIHCTKCKCIVHPISHTCGLAAAAFEQARDGFTWCSTCWQVEVNIMENEGRRKHNMKRSR